MAEIKAIAVELCTAAEIERDTGWWELYEHSFKSNARESRDVIIGSITRNMGRAFRARDGASTVGLATTHLLHDPAAVFLVYLAVAPEYRRHGVGRQLFQRVYNSGLDDLRSMGKNPSGMVWETEDADGTSNATAFFRSQGGAVTERRYRQPPVDGIASVPMQLMFLPAENFLLPTEKRTRDIIRAIYREKYAGMNGIGEDVLEKLMEETSKDPI